MTKIINLISILLICLIIMSGCSISTKTDLFIDKENNGDKTFNIVQNPIFYVEPYDGYLKYTYYDDNDSVVKKVNIGYEEIKKEDLLTLSSSGNYILVQKNMGKEIDRLVSLKDLRSYPLKSSGYQIIAENNESILFQRFNHNGNLWTVEIFDKSNATISESVFYKKINETASEMNEGISLGDNQFVFLFREADGTYLAYVNGNDLIYDKLSDDIMRDIKILKSEENKLVIYKGYKESDFKSLIEPQIIYLTYRVEDNKLNVNVDKIISIRDKNVDLDGSDCLEFINNEDGSYSMLFKYKGNGAIKVLEINQSGDMVEKDSINNFDTKRVRVEGNGFYCFDGKQLIFLDK